jgi:predicted RNA-binding Zn ribbon-like protein
MTPNWVIDPHGRRLPESRWPPERAAPGDLEILRRFCNTVNRENGADRFTTAAGFDLWLRAEGRRPVQPNRRDLDRIVAFRDALHAITRAHNDGPIPPGAWGELAGAVADVSYRIEAAANGLVLQPAAPSRTSAFLGELALICQHAADDGTLRRLKSCVHCQWTVYDASKNQSGRWCSMNTCGTRHNARAYRQRQRA